MKIPVSAYTTCENLAENDFFCRREMGKGSDKVTLEEIYKAGFKMKWKNKDDDDSKWRILGE